MSCVCKNMFFFIVLATTTTTIICSTSAHSEPAKGNATNLPPEYRTWHVHAVNGMSNNKILFVHCKSADDDLGNHNLTVGSEFQWKFKPNIFGKTLFWCYMASVNGHASFKVFWNDKNLYYRCNWKNCYWIGKDDGIYLKNVPENYDEFRFKWNSNSVI